MVVPIDSQMEETGSASLRALEVKRKKAVFLNLKLFLYRYQLSISLKWKKEMKTTHSVLTDSQQNGESKSREFHDGGLEWKRSQQLFGENFSLTLGPNSAVGV